MFLKFKWSDGQTEVRGVHYGLNLRIMMHVISSNAIFSVKNEPLSGVARSGVEQSAAARSGSECSAAELSAAERVGPGSE